MNDRRRLFLPLLCVLLATAAVACGSDGADVETGDDEAPSNVAPEEIPPRANTDHWHASFAVYICDAFVDPVADVGPDAIGIHSHMDGLVHIHPFVSDAAGENARFQLFSDQVGLDVADGVLGLPDEQDYPNTQVITDGAVYRNGDECPGDPGDPGRVALFLWGPDAAEGSAPEVITDDLGSVRFSEDGQRMVLAFVPDGVVPPQPPATPDLLAPADMDAPSGMDP